MKKAILASAMLCTIAAFAELQSVMWADVPDISICRKGDTWYMTSTTMHFNPGIPVMASTNLVDWSIVSYCYDTIENRDRDNLENGKNDYLYGTWASSIRYNDADGYFYVSSFNNQIDCTYLFRTKDIENGEWEFFRIPVKAYDHSMWIEDGKIYFLAASKGQVKLYRLKDDFSGFADDGKVTLEKIADCVPTGKGLAEGCQLFKRGDYYYLFNICWPSGHCRMVACHRSKSLEGPWEGKVVYENEGIAQGGITDSPDGKWYAYLFGDRGGVGRIPYILPMTWEDDWPVISTKESLTSKNPIPGCVADDYFDYTENKLAKVWQFNHNPDNAHWSVTERPGFFRITTSRIDKNLLTAKNTLTQRTFGPMSVGFTKLDYSGMKPGDVAGIALFQQLFGFIAIEKTDKGANIVLWQNGIDASDRHGKRARHAVQNRANASRRRISIPVPENNGKQEIYLGALCDFTPWPDPDYENIPKNEDACRFYWSLDGMDYHPLGDAMFMPYSIPHFTGYRYALFAYSTKEAGGHADFDFFRIDRVVPGSQEEKEHKLHSDGSNPVIKTSFTPDPAAVVDGDTLYLFTGHDDPTAKGYKMHDWQVFKTKDMKHWEALGKVMNCAKTFPWAKTNGAWASQAIKRNGKWYWYVAVFHKGGKSCIGVATAAEPEGPWKDAIGGPLVEGDGFIDPSVFIDDDGQAWLFWGNCGGDPGCWYAPLKENMVELADDFKPVPGLMDEAAFGKPLKKAHGAGARKPIDTNFEEAPWIYKVGDTYYLEYAAGGVPEHWAYSWAKSIHGPWNYGGRILDEAEGTGTIHGGSVFFNGQWYMIYHNATLPGGGDCRRSACVKPYTRNADGSIPFIPFED